MAHHLAFGLLGLGLATHALLYQPLLHSSSRDSLVNDNQHLYALAETLQKKTMGLIKVMEPGVKAGVTQLHTFLSEAPQDDPTDAFLLSKLTNQLLTKINENTENPSSSPSASLTSHP